MRCRTLFPLLSIFSLAAFVGCGSADGTGYGPGSGSESTSTDGGTNATGHQPGEDPIIGDDDAGATSDRDATTTASGPAIKHVVIIVQENHTFDAYFGRYCTATLGSNPTCTTGPACCEAAPDKDPSGASPQTLDDSLNSSHDPDHAQSCEAEEMDNGTMDKFTSGTSCSSAQNFALAGDVVKPYRDYAAKYALADRYFQPIIGQSSSNDMYLARAQYVFTDNAYEPDSNGHGCSITRTTNTYSDKTIADVLIEAKHSFAYYAQGYHAMVSASLCPLPPSDCPAHIPTAPCDYDPGDVPFEYYAQFKDNTQYMKDVDDDLGGAIMNGTLEDVVFVKFVQYKNEHPGYGTVISTGVNAVTKLVNSILASPYKDDTLVLLTWDEGGGFFDHVKPPETNPADNQPYGTRIPLLAMGKFARTNTVSHVVMEHSSIVKFLELNFTGTTGQLAGRDTNVANLGSMLDPATTGITIPED